MQFNSQWNKVIFCKNFNVFHYYNSTCIKPFFNHMCMNKKIVYSILISMCNNIKELHMKIFSSWQKKTPTSSNINVYWNQLKFMNFNDKIVQQNSKWFYKMYRMILNDFIYANRFFSVILNEEWTIAKIFVKFKKSSESEVDKPFHFEIGLMPFRFITA